jgi:hypothetical protein
VCISAIIKNVTVSTSHCLEATISWAGGTFGITASGRLSRAAACDLLSLAACLSGAGAGMVIVHVFIFGNRRRASSLVFMYNIAAVLHGLRIVAVPHKAIFDVVLVVLPAHKK